MKTHLQNRHACSRNKAAIRGPLAYLALAMMLFTSGTGYAQIFTTQYLDGTVAKVNLDGSIVSTSFISGLSHPNAIAVTGNNLFVVSDNTVGLYDSNTGATINASILSGSFITSIVASDSDLFVLDAGTGTIGEYTLTGTVVNSSLISGLSTSSEGLALSGTNLYVTTDLSGNTASVGEYTTSGGTVNSSLITGLDGAVGIAVNGSDIFIGTNGSNPNDTISEYDLSGAPVNTALITAGTFDTEHFSLLGSSLYLAQESNSAVGEYSTSGATINPALASVFRITNITVQAEAVPEPSSWMLLLSGLGLVVLFRRRLKPCRHRSRGRSD